jgi:hypothetical protein
MAANRLDVVALAKLRTELTELQSAVITEAEQIVAHYRGGGDASSSLWNFAHCLALRSRDLRPLQERLARAVALLADVLHRMEGRQRKKNPPLRALSPTRRIISRAAPTALS